MRILLAMWAVPTGIFWGWYFLSLHNMHFGYVMLSRPLHDLVFKMYGDALGIDPATIPGMVGRACVFDTCLIACIIAYRKRKSIAAGIAALRRRYSRAQPAPRA